MSVIEKLWNALLSQEPENILSSFNMLQPDEKILILKHLSRMVDEEGWQPSQRVSAQTALNVINNTLDNGPD